jgi:endonuclease/exonuclease/phosphatase family metal-dependent hydrolase
MEETNMMKKVFRFGFILAVAGSWLTACSLEQTPSTPGFEPDGMVLRASLSDVQTKTTLGTLDNGEYPVLWKAGDKVSVNGTVSSALEADDQVVAEFTVSGSLSAPYKVLYPGTTSANVITLPATQTYVENSFDGTAAACWGNAQKIGGKYAVSLHHFCGVLRFALNGSATLDKIVLKSLGSDKLYGDFELATNGSGFTGAFSGGTSGTLTYNCPGVELSNTDKYFYVLIPAQTYASGIEALVYQSDGAFMRLKFWGTNGYTLREDDVIGFQSKTYAAGRTENLLAINALTAEDGGNPTVTPPSITVACYNVMRLDDDNRPAAATTGDSNGKLARPENAIIKTNTDMRAALGLAIYNTNADIVGFNEIGDDMYQSGQAYSLQDIVAAQGANYTWCLNYPGSTSGNYHYCNGFIYKAAVLTLNDSGRAWLRYNSNSYSTSSDSNAGSPNRYVVWAKFTHKVSGKEFFFFVTQLPTYTQDGGGGSSNLYMSGGVNAFAASKSTTRRILVGDMNSVDHSNNSNQAGADKLLEYWTDGYKAVQAAGNLSSFYQTYSGTQTGTAATYQYNWTQYTKNHPERRIDHVMVQGKCTVKSYRTVRNTYTVSASGYDDIECAPSDHFPVVCEISLDD